MKQAEVEAAFIDAGLSSLVDDAGKAPYYLGIGNGHWLIFNARTGTYAELLTLSHATATYAERIASGDALAVFSLDQLRAAISEVIA